VNQKPTACEGCPAYDHGIGFVPPEPSLRPARFVVVGQGPGEQEAQFSRPFYPGAPSGRMLRGWLEEAGIDSRDVTLGNIVQCWLPQVRLSGDMGKLSRPPTHSEALYCYKTHWAAWINAAPAAAHVLAVGAPATRFLLGLPSGEAAERLAGVTHRFELPPLEVPQ